MTRSESEPGGDAGDPHSSAVQFRAHMEDFENQSQVLLERFERARRKLSESRERVKTRLQSLRRELSRSEELSDALRSSRLKSVFGNGPATNDEYRRRQELARVANHMSDALLHMAVEADRIFRTIFATPAAERLLSNLASRVAWIPDNLSGWTERLQQTAELRAKRQAVPAIPLSGYGQDHDISSSRQAGLNAHLVKPLNLEELYRTIVEVTRESPLKH